MNGRIVRLVLLALVWSLVVQLLWVHAVLSLRRHGLMITAASLRDRNHSRDRR